MLGAIEAGGTKFVLAAGPSPDRITARRTIPTRDPATTLAEAADWFMQQGGIRALGIGSFGPVELDRASARWGFITNTPKAGWAACDIAGHFARALGVPVGFDTDVNAAALAEHRAAGGGSLAYLTIGTGIGGGFCSDGHLLRGLSHPEMGHIRMPRHPEDRNFAGTCPFHGDCLEGLACGPAVIARWGCSLSELPADHPGRRIIAWYIGRALATFQTVMEPARIVLGGGVTATDGLLDLIRAEALVANGGYTVGKIDALIVPPGLGDNAGLLGALALALR